MKSIHFAIIVNNCSKGHINLLKYVYEQKTVNHLVEFVNLVGDSGSGIRKQGGSRTEKFKMKN